MKKTLYIVDTSNWANRAFYALQHSPQKAKDGLEVAAVKQLMKMVAGLLEQARNEPGGAHIALVFDPRSSETWRYKAMQQWQALKSPKEIKLIFPKSANYKGNRDRSKTSDLPHQIDLSREILKAAGFCVLLKKPYECDDIIGTLSTRFSPRYIVKIFSSDKDFAQLLDNENVSLIRQKQSNMPERITTQENVSEVFGVPHSSIICKLALCGDGVDNVPGVPGIAETRSIQLLKEYGTAKELQRQAHKIKTTAVWKKALIGEHPMMDLDLQLELVTIDRNVPKLPKSIDAFKVTVSDDKALRKYKKYLRMSSLFHV